MVVILDKGVDLLPEIAGQEVVLQQNAFLQGLVPALDLALGSVVELTALDIGFDIGNSALS